MVYCFFYYTIFENGKGYKLQDHTRVNWLFVDRLNRSNKPARRLQQTILRECSLCISTAPIFYICILIGLIFIALINEIWRALLPMLGLFCVAVCVVIYILFNPTFIVKKHGFIEYIILILYLERIWRVCYKLSIWFILCSFLYEKIHILNKNIKIKI